VVGWGVEANLKSASRSDEPKASRVRRGGWGSPGKVDRLTHEPLQDDQTGAEAREPEKQQRAVMQDDPPPLTGPEIEAAAGQRDPDAYHKQNQNGRQDQRGTDQIVIEHRSLPHRATARKHCHHMCIFGLGSALVIQWQDG
jgi:hypothetical protein